MPLPVNISNLISGKSVESERIEYKKGWNPSAIYRSICAFVNDFNNIGDALYHRDYQVREPVEIRIYPDSMTILNYVRWARQVHQDGSL